MVTEFKYSVEIGNTFRNGKLAWLSNFGEGWGFMPSSKAVVFIDNHDNQRSSGDIVTYKDSRSYKMAAAYMLAWPYGFTRLMSSFYFSTGDDSPPCDKAGGRVLHPVSRSLPGSSSLALTGPSAIYR